MGSQSSKLNFGLLLPFFKFFFPFFLPLPQFLSSSFSERGPKLQIRFISSHKSTRYWRKKVQPNFRKKIRQHDFESCHVYDFFLLFLFPFPPLVFNFFHTFFHSLGRILNFSNNWFTAWNFSNRVTFTIFFFTFSVFIPPPSNVFNFFHTFFPILWEDFKFEQ